MQFCGDLPLFILPHWYARVVITIRTSHRTINHTPHGSIKSGRPPRRSIVALSHSTNSYLLLLGVTRFIAAVAIFAGSWQPLNIVIAKNCIRRPHWYAITLYAILWRSSFVYTSALIRSSWNSAPHVTHDYQSHSARLYKQRKTPTSEHSGVITLRTLILAPPRGDDIYIPFSYYLAAGDYTYI